MAACFDRALGPSKSSEQLVAVPDRIASDVPDEPLPGDSPEFRSATNEMSDPLTGDGHSRRLGTYPSPTLVVVTAYGSINWVQDWGATGWYGPAGWQDGNGGVNGSTFINGRINGSSNKVNFVLGTQAPGGFPGQYVDSVRAVVLVVDSIRADRSKSTLSNAANHDWDCGTPYYPSNPCIEHSGSTSIVARRVQADLVLTADSTSVKVGSTVTFTYDRSPTTYEGKGVPPLDSIKRIWIPDDTSMGGSASEQVDSATACVYINATSCKRVIQGSGTMVIRAKVNGKKMEKRIRVNAVPCPTGNVMIDHKEVRTGLRTMFTASNADSASGSGRGPHCRDSNMLPVSKCGHKNEHGVWIVRRPNGSFYTVPMDSFYQDECNVYPQWPVLGLPPGDTVMAMAHSHPNNGSVLESVYCLQKDANQRWVKLYPTDPTHPRPGSVDPDYLGGGGSEGDWRYARTRSMDGFVMNDDHEIYVLPWTTPVGAETTNWLSRRWFWRGNPNPACDF